MISEDDKKVRAKISQIRSGIRGLKIMGYKIIIHKDVETTLGSLVDHIYVQDKTGDKVCFQKHLLSIDQYRK